MTERPGLEHNLQKWLQTANVRELETLLVGIERELNSRGMPGSLGLHLVAGQLRAYRDAAAFDHALNAPLT